MPARSDTPQNWPKGQAGFVTTQWTTLLRAADGGPRRDEATEHFCRSYWYPVYAFIRRRGRNPEDALDLTQGFFAKLLSSDWLAGVEKRETRFSTLLLTVLKNYLVNQHAHESAGKRGGGRSTVSIELAEAEGWFGAEPSAGEAPERIFERRWAMAVLDAALARLRAECEATGKGRLFSALGAYLSREPAPGDYRAAAEALGIQERSVPVSVHRLRQQYRAFLREEVAAGLTDPARIDEELRCLRQGLRMKTHRNYNLYD